MVIGEKNSYLAHNAEYEQENSLEWHEKCYAEYEKNNDFEKIGFKNALEKYPQVRGVHIDVGSGAGWLLVKTAPMFKKVVGIEPSAAAVELAKHFTKKFSNITHVNTGMIEAIEQLKISEPIFFTTSTVLSHINDATVVDFLRLINKAPSGSVLFFREPYGKNHQQYLWHIRSKNWWACNLNEWNLEFNGYAGGGYSNGITGVKVGVNNVKNHYPMSINEKIFWCISGLPSRFKYMGKLFIKLFKKR